MVKYQQPATEKNSRRIMMIHKLIRRNKKQKQTLETILKIAISQRKMLMKVCCMVSLFVLNNCVGNITTTVWSCRRLLRNAGWWNLVWNNYSEARCKKTFRMSRATFLFILEKIRHLLERGTVTELPISPEQRLAICLYRLGRGDYFYTIGEMSGLGTSTICAIVSEVCKAIIDCLWKEEVTKYMP